MIRALTVEARHHVCDMRQLLRIKGTNTYLILGLKSLRRVNIKIGANLFRCCWGFDGLNTMGGQQLLNTTRRKGVNDDDALVVTVA